MRRRREDEAPISRALFTLMKYDYWRRVWIIQEFVTSKRFWICFGDNMIPWSMFQAPANDKIHYNGDHPSKASHSLNLFLSLRDERNEGSIPLKDLISLSRDFKCSEPRDRVYGLLGLVPPTDRASLAIDYTKPFLQIFIEAFFRDHWRASSRMFFGSLSTLCCNRDSIQELRRLYLEESLTIPDFQLEVPIHGFIKDLRLHALVCHSGRVIKFRAPSQCSDCTANHSFVYECYIEPSGDSSSRAFSWYYESILYATTKLKIGDALLSVVDPAKAQVVLRSVETGNLACVGMCADVVYSRGSSPQHMEHAGKAPFTQSSSPSSRPKSPSKARAWIKATVRRVSNSPVESSHREEARKVPVIHAQIKPYKVRVSLLGPAVLTGSRTYHLSTHRLCNQVMPFHLTLTRIVLRQAGPDLQSNGSTLHESMIHGSGLACVLAERDISWLTSVLRRLPCMQ